MDQNVFSASQLGFGKGNRTSDALKILHNLNDNYCHSKKANLYGCFVDFSKAFDTVPRDKLLNKLSEVGIGVTCSRLLKACIMKII